MLLQVEDAMMPGTGRCLWPRALSDRHVLAGA